jgi:hypothetical protein
VRRFVAVALVAATWACAGAPALAQQVGSPGPFVFDLRGTTVGVPNKSEFYPAIPPNALVPSRGFGFDVGGHVYLRKMAGLRLGIGANVVWGRATSPAQVVPSADMTTMVTSPAIRATYLAVAPQVSINFGDRTGWSYISGGMGISRVNSVADQQDGTEAQQSSGLRPTANIGAGARWFLNRHLAFGFDIRLYRLSGNATLPQATLFAASAGLAMR